MKRERQEEREEGFGQYGLQPLLSYPRTKKEFNNYSLRGDQENPEGKRSSVVLTNTEIARVELQD